MCSIENDAIIKQYLDHVIKLCEKNEINYHDLILNRKDKNGNTPLFVAVDHHRLQVVSLLLSYGADFEIRNNDQLTPKEFAKIEKGLHDSYAIIELLQAYEDMPTVKNAE